MLEIKDNKLRVCLDLNVFITKRKPLSSGLKWSFVVRDVAAPLLIVIFHLKWLITTPQTTDCILTHHFNA